MHIAETAPSKPDNLFGVCAAIGEDLGFNPLWLRLALGAGILWNPLVMLATYGVMAAVVLGTRLLFPDSKVASVQQPAVAALPQAANTDEPALARAA